MTHEEFTGVTFNDLDQSRTQISRPSKFSVVNSAEIALNIPHRAHMFTRTCLHGVPVFPITNPSVCRVSVLNVRAPYSGVSSFWAIFLHPCVR